MQLSFTHRSSLRIDLVYRVSRKSWAVKYTWSTFFNIYCFALIISIGIISFDMVVVIW